MEEGDRKSRRAGRGGTAAAAAAAAKNQQLQPTPPAQQQPASGAPETTPGGLLSQPPQPKPRRSRKRNIISIDNNTIITPSSHLASKSNTNGNSNSIAKDNDLSTASTPVTVPKLAPKHRDDVSTAPPVRQRRQRNVSNSRKKPKLEHTSDEQLQLQQQPPPPPPLSLPPSPGPRQTQITNLVHPSHPHPPPVTHSPPYPHPVLPQYHNHSPPPSSSLSTRNGNYVAIAPASSQFPQHLPSHQLTTAAPPQPPPPPPPSSQLHQQQPPPRSSGQNYDPIRSTIDGNSTRNTSPRPTILTPPLASRQPVRASASPAITSIIDPPLAPTLQHSVPPPQPRSISTPVVVIPPVPSDTSNAEKRTSQPPLGTFKLHASRETKKPQDSNPTQTTNLKKTSTLDNSETEVKKSDPEPTEIDPSTSKTTATTSSKKPNGAAASASATPSEAPSPKPARTTNNNTANNTNNNNKDTPSLPLPSSGSGLLSGAMFGVEDFSTTAEDLKKIPNIFLHIPLKGKNNHIINFARMAEEEYGFDALHPRVAAQKARRARLAAASAVLEKNERRTDSGGEEDLSLDADKDSDGDGDITMSGIGTTAPSVNGATEDNPDGTKRTRRKKIEEYDRDDPFVDDSEMIWEAQQVACKDGFFVYSGPLVQDGGKVTVEKADGTIKRGRRPRAGPGAQNATTASGSGTTTTARARTTAAESSAKGTGRGGARKPRMTKADRAQMEKEKAEREKIGQGLSVKASGS